MAEFKRNKYGVGYIETSTGELYSRTKTNDVKCDKCKRFPFAKLIVIPCMNEKFCNKCAKVELEYVEYDKENLGIMEMREDDWCEIFRIENGKAPEAETSKA